MSFNDYSSGYDHIFATQLNRLKDDGNYRYFKTIERRCGEFPYADITSHDGVTKRITVWCSNDYLGMGQNEDVRQSVKRAVDHVGAGSGGTRNISGTTVYHQQLEQFLARHHKRENALVFSSGYVANEAALSTLTKIMPECVFLSDSLNHASMIQGLRLNKSNKLIFKHNDVDDLRSKLQSLPLSQPKIIAFESIYSMTGDFAPMADFVALAKEFNAMTYVDEVHAVGLYGDGGRGLVYKSGFNDDVDIIQGTFGKAYGLMGGYVTASNLIIDTIRSLASGFIFTTSLPPSLCAGIQTSVHHLQDSDQERAEHRRKIAMTREVLKAKDIPMLPTNSHIIPVMIGNAHQCKQISDILIDQFNIYAQPINYPTVPEGTERLRINPTPLHSTEDIRLLATGLASAFDQVGLQPKTVNISLAEAA